MMRAIDEQLFHAGIQEISALVAAGADINVIDDAEEGGYGLVHAAASEGWTEMLQALYENGADLNLQDINGQTPLHISIVNEQPVSTKWLLDHGVNTEIMDKYERTPLIQAARQWHKGFCELLIHGGANIDAADPNGWTPLHHASKFTRLDTMKLLVESGADINALGGPGQTPIDRARGKGRAYLQSVAEQRSLEANTAPALAVYDTRGDWAPTAEQKEQDMARLSQSLGDSSADEVRPVRQRSMRL